MDKIDCSFKHICCLLAVRHMFESGVAIKEIARQTRKSIPTIKEWLQIAQARQPRQPRAGHRLPKR
jgi:transposase-like protein